MRKHELFISKNTNNKYYNCKKEETKYNPKHNNKH